MTNPTPIELAALPLSRLQTVLGILMCEWMIWSRPAEVEAKIDARIAEIDAEIKRRENRTAL